MKLFRISLSLLLLFAVLSASGQYYMAGQDPARYKWKQINTDNYQVIYPDQYEKEAYRVAYTLEHSYKFIGASLEHRPQKKYSIILHTASMVSNAFVGISPSRSEFYTLPDQEMLPSNWFEHLALHEGRHMVQIDKVKEEMPALLKILFGEGITALTIGLNIPFWLLEGDAICNETALSNSGRGRFPGFRKEIRAQLIEKGAYTYDKAYLGSFRDYVPNYYHLGYLITAGSRELYGSELWEKTFNKMGSHPLSLRSFKKVLKSEIGGGKEFLYDHIMSHYKSRWLKEDKKLNLTSFSTLSKSTKYFTDYRYPQLMNNGSVVAVKSGLDDITRIVQLCPNGKEKILFTPGNILPNCFSSDGKKLIWIESVPDIRWSLSDRTMVRFLKTGELSTRDLVIKERLLAPVISPEGKSFAVVSVDEKGINTLQIRDIENGKVVYSFRSEDNDYFMNPSWSETGKEILAIAVNSNGKKLLRIDPDKNSYKVLLKPTFTEIRKPFEYEGQIYFIAGKTGIDNLYQFNPETESIESLSSVRFGMDDPLIFNNDLYFTNYTANGYQVARTSMNNLFPSEVSTLKMADDLTVKAISLQEPGVVNYNFNSDSVQYKSKPYRKAAHLFNFHSWFPASWKNGYSQKLPGLTFVSQNLLSTAVTELGYGYNPSEGTSKWKADFSYYGFYPVFNVSITTAQDKEYEEIEFQAGTKTVLNKWQETSLDLNISMPLNFSRGKYYRNITPKFSYELTKFHKSEYYYDIALRALKYEVFGYNLLQKSQRDLFSKWGQFFRLNYIQSPKGKTDMGKLKSAEGWFYLPGLAKHHSLILYGGLQKKDHGSSGVLYSDVVRFARGYTSYRNDDLKTIGVDYNFPILYPDWSLGKLLYFKRIKGGLFFDYSKFAEDMKVARSRISYGGEIRMDCNPFQLLASIDIGGRGIWLHDEQQMRWEFLMFINMNGLFNKHY